MSTLSEVLRILWLIFLWFCFSFIALVSLAMVVIGGWPWGAMFFVAGPVFLAVIDMAHSESMGGKANGGSFNFFFLLLMFISAVGLIILTVLTAFGVLHSEIQGFWSPETNFASWYMVSGLIIVVCLIYQIEPNDDIPDLQRMEQMNRYSTRVGVISAAIFTVLCLVVPLTSFMTSGYDPAALAVALFLTPGSCVLCARVSSTCRVPALKKEPTGIAPCVPCVLVWLAWPRVLRSGIWAIRWFAWSGCLRCSLLPRWQ